MIRVEIYNKNQQPIWDKFISESKNGTFLLCRNYMDYHSDRFNDFSLMFFEDDKLIAVMPANINGDILYSHQGLTYGGIISGIDMKSIKMLAIFDEMKKFLKNRNITKLFYKTIPHIFHLIPAEEDLYALFRNEAKLFRRDLSSTILQENKLLFERGRKRCIDDGKRNNLIIKRTDDFESMYKIIEDILTIKYGLTPVHSAAEMKLLSERFPDNIYLFGCYKDNKMISGAFVFETTNVAHAQYVYSSDEGKILGANDLMYDYLINEKFIHKKYFNFGISTEKEGRYLNENLIRQKEMFGARSICHDFYELEI